MYLAFRFFRFHPSLNYRSHLKDSFYFIHPPGADEPPVWAIRARSGLNLGNWSYENWQPWSNRKESGSEQSHLNSPGWHRRVWKNPERDCCGHVTTGCQILSNHLYQSTCQCPADNSEFTGATGYHRPNWKYDWFARSISSQAGRPPDQFKAARFHHWWNCTGKW